MKKFTLSLVQIIIKENTIPIEYTFSIWKIEIGIFEYALQLAKYGWEEGGGWIFCTLYQGRNTNKHFYSGVRSKVIAGVIDRKLVNIKLTDITSDRNVRGTDITVRISLQYNYTQDMYRDGTQSTIN